MVPARNKAKHLSSVNHTTKTINHHHHHHHHHHVVFNLTSFGTRKYDLVIDNKEIFSLVNN